MVSIALVDARKTSLTGVQNSKKNRLAATRLVDDAPHRHWVKPPPPWKKARSAPEYVVIILSIQRHAISNKRELH